MPWKAQSFISCPLLCPIRLRGTAASKIKCQGSRPTSPGIAMLGIGPTAEGPAQPDPHGPDRPGRGLSLLTGLSFTSLPPP